ncbi:hypothetical protein B0T26DRAFT_671472 [Lasiosphaeria miniovina]|uniref:Uncharacterized protein n=1 Tax=Lasiosphaeria miniovina TaxID=1954250 RepID=A0AA40B2X4_9PEZI|nr:uncharacterized protein B0T26DRAFT_671472 [Lasiosphaeria miniovina]KAK0726703.1 hypothetical protein B0T26DRAFT_671472 [Lasiosphaeria miniovina]
MERRYIVPGSPTDTLLSVVETEGYLVAAIYDIVTNYPPRHRYPQETLHGLWRGPTGLAYLFHRVSVRRPDLVVGSERGLYWAQGYISRSRDHNLRLGSHGCELRDKIDGAIDKGRKCIWSQGMLLKEPSLYHGLFGNALQPRHSSSLETF